MKVLKNSQIRLETLNHALITDPGGKEWKEISKELEDEYKKALEVK